MDDLPENIKEVSMEDIRFPTPPDSLFLNRNRLAKEDRPLTEEAIFIFDHIEILPDGRPQTWLKYFKKPRKGILPPNMMSDLNMAKRATMGYMSVFANKYLWLMGLGFLFMPWNHKIKMVEGFLEGWNRQMQWILGEWFLQPSCYMMLTQEISKFIETFMVRLGFTRTISHWTALCFITPVEYDSQYNYPLKDIFYQVESHAAMLNNPSAEIWRLEGILESRDKCGRKFKFRQFARMLTLLLKIPRVRRAFKQTFAEVRLENLWPDEDDSYWMLRQADYDYDGKSFPERWKKFEEYHTNPETGKVELPKMIKFVKNYDSEQTNQAP